MKNYPEVKLARENLQRLSYFQIELDVQREGKKRLER